MLHQKGLDTLYTIRKRNLDELLIVADNILEGKEDVYHKHPVVFKKRTDFAATRQEPMRINSGLMRQVDVQETFCDGE